MSAVKKPAWKAPAMRLIDAAEKLFGEHGVDGVSLLQIAKQAGQANKYAVQYHFGSKQNLVRAIFETRLERIDSRRRLMLDAIRKDGELTLKNLLRAFIYPVFKEVGADGLHHYVQFAARVLDSPLAADAWFRAEHLETLLELKKLIRELAPHLAPAEFEVRLALVVETLMGALTLIDRATIKRNTESAADILPDTDENVLVYAIDIAVAALTPAPAAQTPQFSAPPNAATTSSTNRPSSSVIKPNS